MSGNLLDVNSISYLLIFFSLQNMEMQNMKSILIREHALHIGRLIMEFCVERGKLIIILIIKLYNIYKIY